MQMIPFFGIHPCFLHLPIEENWLEVLKEYLNTNSYYGVGEIGLDFRKDVLQQNAKEKQMKYFLEQLELSFLLNRPVTIHNVRAHGEMLKIFKKYNKLFSTKQSSNASEALLL